MNEASLLSLAEVESLARQVLWWALGLSVLFGAIAQRTHFCTMGAVADVFTMGDWTRARMWMLAVGVAMAGVGVMSAAGWINTADSLYTTPRLRWLSMLLGGGLFGVGMVLASGCGSKTLVRLGGGNLKSLVVFVVMAVSAWVSMRGLTAVWRQATVDQWVITLPLGQDLPSLVAGSAGTARNTLAGVLGVGSGAALCVWSLSRREGRSPMVLLGGVGIGALVVALWWVSGHLGHVAEHPATLEPAYLASASRQMESFSFVAPMAAVLEWLVLYSDQSRALSFAVLLPLGVVLGSAAMALARKEFRWEGFAGARDTAHHLLGAVLMGVGGIMATGCTIGQGLSGLSTMSVGSLLATAGIVAGALLALRYQLSQS